jgi:flagella synthesis protein FlgN
VQKLVNHLKQEIAWIKELNETLVEEKAILTARQFDKLEEIADKKQALSSQLEASSKERLELIGDPDTQSASNFLKQFLQNCTSDDAKAVNELNNELAMLLITCRESNIINGQVIATNIHTHKEMVNILSGNKIKDVSVYTATGDIKNPTKPDSSHHQKA